MKKRKIQKLDINKSTVSQLTQNLLQGGGTNTCHGNSCCPTEAATCANTCAATCAAGCGVTNDCGPTAGCTAGGRTRCICPTIQLP
ncbi:hypothetical protein [Kordia sp.]|uniref:hypothetical protein n=1 Tax=Kordia sp. TaxID=1965332 RepID=UPI003D6A67D7